jgi:hypothetical protein
MNARRGFFDGRFWWIGFALLAVLLVLALKTSSPKLPVYQHRTLYEWIAVLDKAVDFHPAGFDTVDTAQSAIRAIGTNALPFAMADLNARATPFDPLIGWLAKHGRFLKVHPRDARERWALGVQILDILGPIDKPCLSELISRATNNPGYSEEAMLAVGEAALPAFTNLVRNTQFPETGILIRTFRRMLWPGRLKPEAAAVVLPCLMEMTQSKDRDAAMAASEAINVLQGSPDPKTVFVIQH